MITLYHFKKYDRLADLSPFCVKVDTYLRLAKIPYQSRPGNYRKSKRGKLPVIKHGDQFIENSTAILEYLDRVYDNPLDKGLCNLGQSLSQAYQKMLEEHFYWVLVYMRWIEESGWKITKEVYFSSLNRFKRRFYPIYLRPIWIKKFKHQHLATLTKEEIYKEGIKDVSSLVAMLEKRPYFLGDNLRSIDATVYAFLVTLIYFPIENSIKDFALSSDKLVSYCKRIEENFKHKSHQK